MPISPLLLTGILLAWLIACLVMAAFARELKHSYPSFLLFGGGLAMFVAAVFAWQTNFSWDAPAPIFLALAPLTCHIDSLSSIFIGLLALLSISVSLFSSGYLPHLEKKINAAAYWVQLFFFIIGMLGVILAANALTFLLFWETMALASLLLIAANLSSHESRHAALIYLGATRFATTLIMAGFLWLYTLFHSWNFSDWHFAAPSTILPGLLILLGLCLKSGIWPFHGWLPYAHPAAPSPVSALMSGVMIKVSLYAIIRLFVMNGQCAPLLSYLMLSLGVISAFWGVLCALMQHDLKRLLAYHSIENVGLILIGVSLAGIGQSLNLPAVATLGLAAAIFHCVNHGIFKSLLFLAAGSIDCRAHTRDIEHLGGLGKSMPGTMLFFLVGSAAICALPPLNGFNSKWLVYQSFFQLADRSGSLWLGGMAVSCIGILALVSGMALYCFTKALGISFLGRARSSQAEHAQECTPYMLASQALLAAACLFLGICAPLALAVIQPVCDAAIAQPLQLADAYQMPLALIAIALLALSLIIYRFCLQAGKNGIKPYITWDCGFGPLGPRMQGQAGSFAESIIFTFGRLFQYKRHLVIDGQDRRAFPESISLQEHKLDIIEFYVYAPTVRLVAWLGKSLVWLQVGSVHLYLGYVLFSLVLLLLIGILL